jgi:hypothetical protein
MTFQLVSGGVMRDDGAFIPNDSKNRDWQAYLAWVGAGNVAAPADAPPVIDPADTVSIGKLVRLLARKGLLSPAELG